MDRKRRLEWVSLAPALAVGVAFELWLGHRHDYSGHYAAGFGASFAACMFALKGLPEDRYQQLATQWVLPFCLALIAGGGLLELTAFRIAKFDEVDFFNQSLGAVLAVACGLAYVDEEKPQGSEFDNGLIGGIILTGVGGVLAVA